MKAIQETACQAKKRRKLSFVCQLCRKSKTKCDRKKPTCGRCARLGKPCIYDLEYQPLPRKPNKDAAMSRLQKELEYWKYFANVRMNEIKAKGSVVKKSDSESEPAPSKQLINLVDFNPQLVYQEFRFSELRVFTNIAQIKHDCFLSTFLATFFVSGSKEELIHNVSPYLSCHTNNDDPKYTDRVLHLRQNLLFRFTTEAQSNRIQDFTDRLLTGREVLINYRTAFFVTLFSNVFFQAKIPDSKAPDEPYPLILQKLISEANALLPSKDALLLYKSYFYRRVYHIYPYFDIYLFEEILDEILFDDPERLNRMVFDLNNDNFRYKISNIALLMLVLKVSYGALYSVIDTDYNLSICSPNFIQQNPIADQAIVFAEICLAKLCVFSGANEVHISCMLFIWNFFCSGNGDDDSVFGRATDVVTQMLSTLAMNNGLGRDATQYHQYQVHPSIEPHLQNFRRKLSLNVISTSVISGILTGNFPSSIRDSAKNFLNLNGGRDTYIGLVKRSMQKFDAMELKVQGILFKVYRVLMLLMDFEKLVKKGSEGLELTEIEFISNTVLESLNLNFSMDFDFIGGPKLYKVELSNGESVDCEVMDSYHNIQTQILVRNFIVHLDRALFLYFENACVQGRMENLVHYKKYLMESTRQTLELTKLCIVVLEGGFDRVLADGFNMERCKMSTEIVFPTVVYSLLALGLRLAHAELTLSESIKSFDTNVIDVSALQGRLSLLTSLRKNSFFAIGRLSDAMSASFQYKNFCTFRSLLFIDAVIKLDMSRGLMNLIMYALNPENGTFSNINPKMQELLTYTIRFNTEDIQKELEKMEKAQFLSIVDEGYLHEMKDLMQSLRFSFNQEPVADHVTRQPSIPHGVSELNDYFKPPF